MDHAPLASFLTQLRHTIREGPPAQASNQELLRSFLSADRAASEFAFAVLVDRYGGLVFDVCRRLLCRTQDAEDAFQVTFLLLARRAASIRQPQFLGTWLYRVAGRAAGRLRQQAAAAAPMAAESTSSTPDPA